MTDANEQTHVRSIEWVNGGTARVVQATGVVVVVRSSRPFPPGAPAHGILVLQDPKKFTLKVAGAKKVDGDTWEVRGRLVTATSDVIAAFQTDAT